MATNRQIPLPPATLGHDWAAEPGAEYGEVFTRRWVVEFILDLVGYDPAADLAAMTIIEPSCGTGAFLLPIVERLIASCEQRARSIVEAADAVTAFDLLPTNAKVAREAVLALLVQHGVQQDAAERLVNRWVRAGDFLLAAHPADCADFVVGNPPYIRLEDVPSRLTDEYRRSYPTMRGRSDIYVGFFEKGI